MLGWPTKESMEPRTGPGPRSRRGGAAAGGARGTAVHARDGRRGGRDAAARGRRSPRARREALAPFAFRRTPRRERRGPPGTASDRRRARDVGSAAPRLRAGRAGPLVVGARRTRRDPVVAGHAPAIAARVPGGAGGAGQGGGRRE